MDNTTNTLYEQINKYCEMGYYPIVKRTGYQMMVSPHKDINGCWRETDFDTLEVIKTRVGHFHGSAKTQWEKREKEGYKIVGFYKPAVSRFKKGDKVKISADVINKLYSRDCDGLYEVGVVVDINSYYYRVLLDEDKTYSFSHDQLEPYLEQGVKKTVILELTDEQLKKIKEILK